jgi:ankyrin repeat protein
MLPRFGHDSLSYHCCRDVVQLLLQTDPELAVLPDMTANTPLHWACQAGNTALVQQILQVGGWELAQHHGAPG